MGILLTIVFLGLYEKSEKNMMFLYAFATAVIGLSIYNPSFTYLACIAMFLGVFNRSVLLVLLSCVTLLIVNPLQMMPVYLLSGLLGYVVASKHDIEMEHIQTFDDNRRSIYELEDAKTKLHTSQIDLIQVTELNERNRIARSIHDNLGHKLVGSKMLLEAASAINGKDSDKSEELIKRVINELGESVYLLRDTVHDLRPNQDVGITNIRNIIKRFAFCTVDFKTEGDLNSISSGLYAVVERNLKEALTNVNKYSNATLVHINIEVTEKYIRFSVTDNGTGTNYINEGLGISGMRERVENIGGTFTLDFSSGFKLYMFFPKRSNK